MANDVCQHVFTDELPLESCTHPSLSIWRRGVMTFIFVSGFSLRSSNTVAFTHLCAKRAMEIKRDPFLQNSSLNGSDKIMLCLALAQLLSEAKVTQSLTPFPHLASSICPVTHRVCMQSDWSIVLTMEVMTHYFCVSNVINQHQIRVLCSLPRTLRL